MSVDIDERELVLTDGRRLAWREWGTRDAPALLYFHGTPGSRFGLRPGDPLVARPDLRVLVVDRPGYGRSDPAPQRTLSSWARDVEALADAAGLARFVVAGVSGGGPHALACACVLPERVALALLLACPAPLELLPSLDELAFGNRLGVWLESRAPRLLAKLIELNAASFGRDAEGYMCSLVQHMPAPDRALLDRPSFRAAIVAEIAEAYRQGPGGQLVDARLALTTRTWDIALADVRVPVRLWQGELDRLSTPSMAAALARELPDVRLTLIPGAGHLIGEHPRCIAEFQTALAEFARAQS